MRQICKSAVLAVFAGAMFSAQAETFIRGNLAGYYPNAEKRIVVMSSENISEKSWNLTDEAGQSAASGKVGRSIEGDGDNSPMNYNYEIIIPNINKEGNYTLAIEGADNFTVKVSNNPYKNAIESVVRWLRVQRSGTNETLDRMPAHFGDSAAFVYYRSGDNKTDEWKEDENGKTLDLSGGWYVGGDYTKSTAITAYTVYNLLKAYNTSPESFVKKYSNSALTDILDEAKFGLDYLLKVMPNETDFIINVGGYDSENGIRLPNEDIMEGKRAAYSIFSSSDMGLAAAALAAGAETFKTIDAAQAEKYKAQAIKIYDKAVSDGKPEWIEKDWGLYPDESDRDNLLIAAMQLYKLTGDAKYLDNAKSIGDNLEAAYWAGWETQNMIAQLLVAEQNPKSKEALLEDLNSFAGNSRGNVIWHLPLEYTTNGLYNCFIIGISAGIYSKQFNEKTYENMVLDVLNYNYGLNNWGVSFTALPDIKQSVRRFQSPIYKLQTKLFPEGATAIGPCDRESHDGESKWILDDIRVNYAYPFNTPAVVFLDHDDDYMTMEARISAAAEIVYLMTLSNTIFGGK